MAPIVRAWASLRGPYLMGTTTLYTPHFGRKLGWGNNSGSGNPWTSTDLLIRRDTRHLRMQICQANLLYHTRMLPPGCFPAVYFRHKRHPHIPTKSPSLVSRACQLDYSPRYQKTTSTIANVEGFPLQMVRVLCQVIYHGPPFHLTRSAYPIPTRARSLHGQGNHPPHCPVM